MNLIKRSNIKYKICEEMIVCEIEATTGAIAFVIEMHHDAHVAEVVATSHAERVLHHLHADRAQKILVHLPF